MKIFNIMGNCCKLLDRNKSTSYEVPDDDLFPADCKDIAFRTFESKLLPCKVVDVYDGDTITIVARLNRTEPFYKYKLRLYKIDAPEMKPKLNVPNRELHVKCAHLVKDYVQSLILNKIFNIYFYKEEKFGRLMGDLQLSEEITLSDHLIKLGLVKSYHGEAKTEFTKAELEQIVKFTF